MGLYRNHDGKENGNYNLRLGVYVGDRFKNEGLGFKVEGFGFKVQG